MTIRYLAPKSVVCGTLLVTVAAAALQVEHCRKEPTSCIVEALRPDLHTHEHERSPTAPSRSDRIIASSSTATTDLGVLRVNGLWRF